MHARKSVLIKAPPQLVFDIVSDISRHNELAGSGEVLRVRKLTEGAVGVGTRFEADEDIRTGPQRMKFVAQSEVVAFDPPHLISWTSRPPMGPKKQRIQWWVRLTPQNGGTGVAHEVEVDMGLLLNLLMKLPYQLMRGGRLAKGMDKTLQNLKMLAETRAA